MDDYIKISNLNDFLFCPRSIYFHGLYENYEKEMFQDTFQKVGTHNHKNIDEKIYSSGKNILQGVSVFCEKYNIAGKIDIFDIDKKTLIERKTYISKLHIGYKMQIYGQYFCLKEAGYEIEKLKLYSLKDNKSYDIDLPSSSEIKFFEQLLIDYKNFDLNSKFFQVEEKCKNCIYKNLCDFYLSNHDDI